MPDETHFALLGFQTNKWSRPDCSIFTVNLTVISRKAWETKRATGMTWLPAEPEANTHYALGQRDFEWVERLGVLLPEASDKWWEV